MTKEEYKRAFIYFTSKNGTWDAWKHFFRKSKTFNKVIDCCINPNEHKNSVFRKFIVNGTELSTPYSIDWAYKKFDNNSVYRITKRNSLYISVDRERFEKYLTKLAAK